MTEIRTPHLTDDAIPSAAQWNAAFRGLSREIQDLFLRLLFGDDTPSTGDGGVVGGLVCSAVTGQMQTRVSAGWAFRYDGTLASPQSKLGVVPLHAEVIVDHDDGDGTNDRIDVISIVAPTGTDNEESVLMWEAAPQNLKTQRGAQASVVVTKGTPDAVPVAPTTPSGHVKLFEVVVEAGFTNLNGALYTDKRVRARGLYERDADDAMLKLRSRASTGFAALIQMLGHGVAASSLEWDRSEDWLRLARGKGLSGDAVYCYPMMSTSGRAWWRSISWLSSPTQSDNAAKIEVGWAYGSAGPLRLTRGDTSAWGQYVRLPVPVDARGLEVVAAKVRYKTTQAFDGTINTREVKLWHRSNGTLTDIGAVNLTLASTHGSVQTATITLTGTPTLVEGDELFAVFALDLTASGTAVGVVELHSLDIQFKEGRA